MIGLFIKLSVQTFQPLILINRRSIFVYHHWGCTSNFRPLSYSFRSLKKGLTVFLPITRLNFLCFLVIWMASWTSIVTNYYRNHYTKFENEWDILSATLFICFFSYWYYDIIDTNDWLRIIITIISSVDSIWFEYVHTSVCKRKEKTQNMFKISTNQKQK